MTFSLVARDPRTGAFGMVVTSSSPAVAARCVHLRSAVGGVASQNVTDPGLGERILNALESGSNAQLALDSVARDAEHIDFRQVAVVDKDGNVASFSGSGTLGTNRVVALDGAVAAGNLLSDPGVPAAIMAAYQNSAASAFERRLLDGLVAGLNAGGEEGTVHSAGLVVVDGHSWASTDLRVDWDDEDPIGVLEDLWERWAPEKEAYRSRAINPTIAPSYGVPGDL
ncbi:DUF1028 domain-containing protein [Paeniglutamicibacter sp. NPDC091659]|uniref:DUF1028 domain-containing protein n=1 Tax=Paeniglutamicibacter sp. NPDC091659 TaxID=3364389 RepID=UPI00380CB75E